MGKQLASITGADSEMIGIAKRAYVNYAHALWGYGAYDDENIIKLEKNHTINGYYLNENYWRYPLPLSIISLSWKIVSTYKWQANVNDYQSKKTLCSSAVTQAHA